MSMRKTLSLEGGIGVFSIMASFNFRLLSSLNLLYELNFIELKYSRTSQRRVSNSQVFCVLKS